MKKVLLFSFLALGAVSAYALQAPVSQNGTGLPIEYVGCQTASIDSSTGTNLVIANSTGTAGTSIGAAVVYGVITSSIAQSDYLVLKDSSGKGMNGLVASQTLLQNVGATVTIVGNYLQSASSVNTQFPYPTINLIKFPVPLQFPNGILMNASVTPVSNNGVSRWTILYRKLNQTEK